MSRKTYDFTVDEFTFLKPQSDARNSFKMAVDSLDAVMSSYIRNTVLKRLGLDEKKFNVFFDIGRGKIECEEIEEKKEKK